MRIRGYISPPTFEHNMVLRLPFLFIRRSTVPGLWAQLVGRLIMGLHVLPAPDMYPRVRCVLFVGSASSDLTQIGFDTDFSICFGSSVKETRTQSGNKEAY